MSAVTLHLGQWKLYLEVLMQSVNAHRPGICESGGGLYFGGCARFSPITVHTTLEGDFRHAGETGSG